MPAYVLYGIIHRASIPCRSHQCASHRGHWVNIFNPIQNMGRHGTHSNQVTTPPTKLRHAGPYTRHQSASRRGRRLCIKVRHAGAVDDASKCVTQGPYTMHQSASRRGNRRCIKVRHAGAVHESMMVVGKAAAAFVLNRISSQPIGVWETQRSPRKSVACQVNPGDVPVATYRWLAKIVGAPHYHISVYTR